VIHAHNNKKQRRFNHRFYRHHASISEITTLDFSEISCRFWLRQLRSLFYPTQPAVSSPLISLHEHQEPDQPQPNESTSLNLEFFKQNCSSHSYHSRKTPSFSSSTSRLGVYLRCTLTISTNTLMLCPSLPASHLWPKVDHPYKVHTAAAPSPPSLPGPTIEESLDTVVAMELSPVLREKTRRSGRG